MYTEIEKWESLATGYCLDSVPTIFAEESTIVHCMKTLSSSFQKMGFKDIPHHKDLKNFPT
jgi:hypothetical protein